MTFFDGLAVVLAITAVVALAVLLTNVIEEWGDE